MARGRGVGLQKYQAGGKLSDMQIFKEEEGFCYNRSGGVANEKELLTWLGHRAQVGAAGAVRVSEEQQVF